MSGVFQLNRNREMDEMFPASHGVLPFSRPAGINFRVVLWQ